MTSRPTGHALTLPGFVLLLCAALAGPADAGRAALDPRIRDAIVHADSVATQRLLDEVTREHEKPTVQRLGDPMDEARLCDLAWRDTLLNALRIADIPAPTRAPSQPCTCYAEVRVIFWSDSSRTTLRFCTLCGEVGVILGSSKADHLRRPGTSGAARPVSCGSCAPITRMMHGSWRSSTGPIRCAIADSAFRVGAADSLSCAACRSTSD